MRPLLIRKLVGARLPAPAWWPVWALVAVAVLTPNTALTIGVALLLAWVLRFLYRPGEPQILLLAGGFQWLQVSTKVLQANFQGVSVDQLNAPGGDLERATWLAIISLAVLVAGMRLAIGPQRSSSAQLVVQQQAGMLAPRRVYALYVAIAAAGVVALVIARVSPGLAQLALAFAGLKWAALFMLVYVCQMHKGVAWMWISAFALELALGLGGYFSSFQTVFYVTLLGLIAAGRKLSLRQVVVLTVVVAALFMTALAWTAVKFSYRDYVSGGVSAQIVTRGYQERMLVLADMVLDLNQDDLTVALEDMANRISYVTIFGHTLGWVPGTVPHTGGVLWFGAVRHILMPRLLFPDKEPLPSDSEYTNAYSGLIFRSGDEGTSVSMGYVAEAYADFGIPLMFMAVLALGWIWGRVYRALVLRGKGLALFNQGLAIPVLLMLMQFEASIIKVLGGVITGFIVAWLVKRYFSGRLIDFLAPSAKRRVQPAIDIRSKK